jgi:hypothetical protein
MGSARSVHGEEMRPIRNNGTIVIRPPSKPPPPERSHRRHLAKGLRLYVGLARRGPIPYPGHGKSQAGQRTPPAPHNRSALRSKDIVTRISIFCATEKSTAVSTFSSSRLSLVIARHLFPPTSPGFITPHPSPFNSAGPNIKSGVQIHHPPSPSSFIDVATVTGLRPRYTERLAAADAHPQASHPPSAMPGSTRPELVSRLWRQMPVIALVLWLVGASLTS